MNYYAIFGLALCVALIGLAWRQINNAMECDACSPFNLLYWSWFCPLMLLGLNLSPLEIPWSLEAWGGIVLVTLGLTSVSLMPALRGFRGRPFSTTAPAFLSIGRQLNNPKADILLIGVFSLDLSLYIYTEFILNPDGFLLINALLGKLGTHSNETYYFFKGAGTRPGYASLVLTFTSFLNILGAIFYLKFRFTRNSIKKCAYLFIAILPLIFGIIKLSKFDAVLPFVTLIMTEYYWQKFHVSKGAEQRRSFFYSMAIVTTITVAFVVIIFYSTAVFRVGETISEISAFRWLAIEVDDPSIFDIILAYVYVYTALNFENAARFIGFYEGQYMVGVSSLRPFLSMILQGGVADEMLQKIDLNTITPGFNAGTFIPLIFAELRWLGLFAVPTIYALIVNVLYSAFRREPTLNSLLLYLNFSFCWIFLFFSNAFAVLSCYTNGVFILILGAVLLRLAQRPPGNFVPFNKLTPPG